MRPGQPALVHAPRNALMNVVIRLPFTFLFVRLNTQGQMIAFLGLLSLQDLLERVGEREGPAFVVLRCCPASWRCSSRGFASVRPVHWTGGTPLPCLCSPHVARESPVAELRRGAVARSELRRPAPARGFSRHEDWSPGGWEMGTCVRSPTLTQEVSKKESATAGSTAHSWTAPTLSATATVRTSRLAARRSGA